MSIPSLVSSSSRIVSQTASHAPTLVSGISKIGSVSLAFFQTHLLPIAISGATITGGVITAHPQVFVGIVLVALTVFTIMGLAYVISHSSPTVKMDPDLAREMKVVV